jgi:hypothetical protein
VESGGERPPGEEHYRWLPAGRALNRRRGGAPDATRERRPRDGSVTAVVRGRE